MTSVPGPAVVVLDEPDEERALDVGVHLSPSWLQQFSAGALIVVPLAGVIYASIRFWNRGIGWFDLSLAVAMYLFTGFGLSVGFHRLLSHRCFKPARWLKITLAIAGSMGMEGSLLTWVAQHRRHHAFTDREGDPHSPHLSGPGLGGQLRGLWHAHLGWFFVANPSYPERWSPDMLADRDLMRISDTAALWAVVSLGTPFGIGWLVTGTVRGALLAFVWAGLVRLALLHHVTWGVNSLGHMFGRRPYRTRDMSTNFAPMAVLSFGDSWHNAHHAFPTSARHGVDRGQLDASGRLIWIFERLGWATEVRWVDPARLTARRLAA